MTTAAATNRRYLSLGFFLLICFAASAAGGLATYPIIGTGTTAYISPTGHLRNELFGPIWTVLYAMMAVAPGWFGTGSTAAHFPALKLFAYQLGLNVLWSILFFALAESRRRRSRNHRSSGS